MIRLLRSSASNSLRHPLLQRSALYKFASPARLYSAQNDANSPPPNSPSSGNSTNSTAGSKPRKPLSRVAIGGTSGRVSKGSNQVSARTVWTSLLVMILGGGALSYFFQKEKKRLEVRRQEKERQGVGKPLIGGPFEMMDFNGNKFTEKDLEGKFSIIYFGFTMCPDVCPEELEILAQVLRTTNKDPNNKKIQPIFVTCDPARDTPEVLREYLSDFHPDIIGLTGTYDQVKNMCKKYRVYFSTPPNVKPGQSYLVDHSIFFYMMDPEGKFIDVLGRNYTGPEALAKVEEHLDAWRPSTHDDRTFLEKLFG